jgi:hypothetical protein
MGLQYVDTAPLPTTATRSACFDTSLPTYFDIAFVAELFLLLTHAQAWRKDPDLTSTVALETPCAHITPSAGGDRITLRCLTTRESSHLHATQSDLITDHTTKGSQPKQTTSSFAKQAQSATSMSLQGITRWRFQACFKRSGWGRYTRRPSSGRRYDDRQRVRSCCITTRTSHPSTPLR